MSKKKKKEKEKKKKKLKQSLLASFLCFDFISNFYTSSVFRFSGLISPGVSVPIQVPGAPQDMGAHMGSMATQYWPRIQ